VVGELTERRKILLPNDEKLVAQPTSRRRLYDSKGRERLESKADMRARGLESQDRADAQYAGPEWGITARELAGIAFGRSGGGPMLFGMEPVSFKYE
jgi:hypothetical protein